MSPFIRDGDVITVAPGPARRGLGVRAYGTGQIVAFVNPANQRLVVHRIVGQHESLFRLQGDNLRGRTTSEVDRDSILGRVVCIERGRKRVWLGLGPERFGIAFLSRVGLLIPVRAQAAALIRLVGKPRQEVTDCSGSAGVRDAG